MADAPVSTLPNLAAPISTDIVYAVDDPAGAPLSSQLSLGALATAIGLTYDAVNSRIQLADAGTDALPAVALDSDPNTGMYWSAADTLAFSTGGSARMTIAAASIKNPIDSAGYYTGASDDLRLYHTGTDGFLANATGSLAMQTLAAQPFLIYTNSILAVSVSSVQQVFNPADNAGFYTGASNDVRLYHDGTNSILTNATGLLQIINIPNFGIEFYTNALLRLKVDENGAVLNAIDSQGYFTGASNDLRMYHDGTNSFLENATGNMYVSAPVASGVALRVTGTGDVCQVYANGVSNLFDSQGFYTGASADLRMYHDGTDSHLLNITGNTVVTAPAGSGVSSAVTGTGTILNVVATGVLNSVDDSGFYTGVGTDGRFYHTGTATILANLNAATPLYLNSADSGVRVPVFAADPGVLEDGMIWYDSATDKLMVRANGVSVAVH